MKFPCLVYRKYCKTPATLVIEQEGIDKYGEPLEATTLTANCNYQDTAKTILTAEKKLIQLSGTALFRGDVCPSLPNISGGSITVNGITRRIYAGRKCRNPDGTVNYTEVQVV